MSNTLYSGTAVKDISPEKGVELAGYPHYPRYNTGIHDPLMASCLYLEKNDVKVIIMSLDILFLSKKYNKTLRDEISAKCGVPAKNIMIACTHTHSGPWASGRLDFEAIEKGLGPDENYIKYLFSQIKDCAEAAVLSKFEAEFGTGKTVCGAEKGVGGNRRYPKGLADPEVSVASVKDKSGKLRACVVNYALHPTFLHADSTLVSADYPGYIRKYISEMYRDTSVLFLQGCSGNQSSRYFRTGQSFEEAQRVGTELGIAAAAVIKNINWTDDISIYSDSCELEMKSREFPSLMEAKSAVARAEAEYRKLIEDDAPYIEKQNANVKLLGAEDLLGYVTMLDRGVDIPIFTDEKPPEVQVISAGEAVICGFQGELFVEFGLLVKRQFPVKTVFVSTSTNGALPGYVYTREALKEGGYEVDTSMLSPETGYHMVEAAVSLISDRKDANE